MFLAQARWVPLLFLPHLRTIRMEPNPATDLYLASKELLKDEQQAPPPPPRALLCGGARVLCSSAQKQVGIGYCCSQAAWLWFEGSKVSQRELRHNLLVSTMASKAMALAYLTCWRKTEIMTLACLHCTMDSNTHTSNTFTPLCGTCSGCGLS